ncbi:MAG: hypothetical protein AAB316_09920, partial [Bacteroidota bacterium]
KPRPVDDWFCKTLVVKLVAVSAEVSATEEVKLADGIVKIKPHSNFRANLSLGCAGGSTRDLNNVSPLQKMFGEGLLNFGGNTRGIAAQPLNVLEISNIQDDASLREQPLTIELDANLGENEYLLPITFDGEHFLPVGQATKQEGGRVEVSISEIPDVRQGERSLFKALKLCFCKLVLRQEVNKLRWVEYLPDGIGRREDDLQKKVKAAKKILLVLHGIIGDTGQMADSLRPLVGKGKCFDLVLAYDYENLNTPIQTTAGNLKKALTDAGLKRMPGKAFNKKFTILAHSMGGLVARHFIENLDGRQVVSHLVMAGTPNGGSAMSNLAKYRDIASVLLTLAANSGFGIPAAASILGVLSASKSLTVTLEQMGYEHEGNFLKNLEDASDPGIRYSILAGRLEDFLKKNEETGRLLNKVWDFVANRFYDVPNDIAVSVESIRHVPEGRKPVAQCHEVECHHLNYFEDKGSLEVLTKLLCSA